MQLRVITICLLFPFLAFIPRRESTVRLVQFLDCQSGIIYTYNGSNLKVYGTLTGKLETLSDKIVEKGDSKHVALYIDSLFVIDRDEIFYNHCVNDGFHFKGYFLEGKKKKKIFVGNTYERRLDGILTILNKYVDTTNYILKYNRIGFGSDADYKQELLEDQKKCNRKPPESFLNHLLNDWCELEDQHRTTSDF